jgi:hypothetical protein
VSIVVEGVFVAVALSERRQSRIEGSERALQKAQVTSHCHSWGGQASLRSPIFPEDALAMRLQGTRLAACVSGLYAYPCLKHSLSG